MTRFKIAYFLVKKLHSLSGEGYMWSEVKLKPFSHVQLFATMEFSSPEY